MPGKVAKEEPAKPFGAYLDEAGGDAFEAANSYFKTELKSNMKFVDTVIGKVYLTGAGWKELKRGMKSDEIKARLTPHIVDILRSGKYEGKTSPRKERTDGFVAFHFFEKEIDLSDIVVTAGVNVGQRDSGMYELTAYGLGHSLQDVWAKRKASDAPGNEPGTEAFKVGVPASLDSMLSGGDEGSNIVILKVIDKATGRRLTELEDVSGQGGDIQVASLTISGDELGVFPETEEGKKALRKAAIDFYASSLMTSSGVINLALDRLVEFDGRGRGKIKSFSADPRKLHAVAKLESIVRDGKPTPISPMKPHAGAARSGVKQVHVLKTPVSLNGEPLTVRFLVHEMGDGHFFYDHSIDRKEAERTLGGSAEALDSADAADLNLPALPPNEPSSGQCSFDSVSKSGKVFNLFIEGEEMEEVVDDRVSAVDAAYLFANATDEFKVWVFESLLETDYSPFFSAKEMDQAVNRNGAKVEWGSFRAASADADSDILNGDDYVGKIKKGGKMVGRIDIGDDGKAMVYLGKSGSERVMASTGRPFMYSDSDGPYMVDALFASQAGTRANGGTKVDPQAQADVAYLDSVIAGSIDLLHPDVGTKLEEIYARAEANPDLLAKFEAAAMAYSDFVVAKAKIAASTAALESVGKSLVDAVLKASPISEAEAAQWAQQQAIDKAAIVRLKKNGYGEAQLRADIADYYRLSGGKAPNIEIRSDGNRRAHASGVTASVGAKIIRVDSNFNRVVLFHELAHFIEGDPAALEAANAFLRKRRESDTR